LKLSVLDQSVVCAGRPQDEAIRNTVNLAAHCETWGYQRFWVSEHHSLSSMAGTAPEILLAAIAMRTTRIRLGSAGIMLPHYAAFKVAEQFRVLDAWRLGASIWDWAGRLAAMGAPRNCSTPTVTLQSVFLSKSPSCKLG